MNGDLVNLEGIDLGHGHMLLYLDPNAALIRHWQTFGEGMRPEAHIELITFSEEMRVETDSTPAQWTVESWEPLSISPSLECTYCGDHGFIRAGRWIPV